MNMTKFDPHLAGSNTAESLFTRIESTRRENKPGELEVRELSVSWYFEGASLLNVFRENLINTQHPVQIPTKVVIRPNTSE